MMGFNVRVFGSIILAMLFWSFSFVWVKIAFEGFLPITVIFLRLLISTAILMVGFGAFGKIQRPKKQHYKWFLLLAFFEPFVYFIAESYGLKIITATTASVIISTIPLLTPISAFLFFKEKLTLFNYLGLFVSFLGVMLIVVSKNFTLIEPVFGMILMFIAVLTALGYGVMVKKLSAEYNSYTITGFQNLIGLILFLPLFLIFDWSSFRSTPFNSRAVVAVIELAIFASTFSFLLFTYAINHIGLSRSSMFANIIPVFTSILAWWILGETIDERKISGIIVVVAGLFISYIKPSNHAIRS